MCVCVCTEPLHIMNLHAAPWSHTCIETAFQCSQRKGLTLQASSSKKNTSMPSVEIVSIFEYLCAKHSWKGTSSRQL